MFCLHPSENLYEDVAKVTLYEYFDIQTRRTVNLIYY